MIKSILIVIAIVLVVVITALLMDKVFNDAQDFIDDL